VVEKVRYHLDEHVPPAIAKALRKYGIDVTTTVEAGLRTLGDREHLEFARSEGRIIEIPKTF
jgi:predicted nuclease of predicted toxin-antitoxin system